MTAIKLTDVSKTIHEKVILDHINLELEQGGIYGFYGPNGSGKSMLFRVICGIIHPTNGEVEIFGEKLGQKFSFPPSLGVMIENVGFWKEYSGFQNLKILSSIKKMITDDQIRHTLEHVGLASASSLKYSKYSLGMKQRLAIAQAIMEEPELIILDEPTNALDQDGVRQIRKVIREEQERGATILIASHNSEDLSLLCDCSYYMNAGKLSQKSEIEKGENI